MRHPKIEPPVALARADVPWAVITAAAALMVYVRTLAPGVIPILDTPGFQFVGRVLGTLHHPGYPAYVMITWAWSFLPIGSLAYRINLFSGVAASLAVAGTFVLMRLLGVGRMIAAAGTLAMAFGSIFWSQAVIAEVYTLNAALIAWMLAALVAWGATRRTWLLYASASLFAIGLGNHSTIVLFAPGMAIYALLVGRDYVLRLRTLAGLSLIVLLGLSQYLFILVRTRMGAVYLESQAATLAELIDVMRGAQFEHALFAFSIGQLLTTRVPLISRFLVAELTLPALVLALAGVVWLTAQRRREALLICSGAAGTLLFVLNYDAGDIHVFMIPLAMMLWCLVGCGIQAVARWAPAARLASGLVLAAAFALPAWQMTRNFTERDLSDDTEAMRQMDGLFAALPGDTFLVRENFVLDRMLMYKILGEAVGAEREIQAHNATAQGAAAMHASGRHVLTFSETAHRYRYEGTNVRYAPFEVHARTLDQFLADLPAGTQIALGIPGALAHRFHREAGVALARIANLGSLAGREQAAIAIAGATGAPQRSRAKVDARSGVTASVGAVIVRADAVSAVIEFGWRETLRAEDGAVLAVLRADGTLHSVRVLAADAGFRIRSSPGPFIPARVGGMMPVRQLGEAWSELAGDTGLWLLSLAPMSTVRVAAEARDRCDLRAVDKSSAALRIAASIGEQPPLTGRVQQITLSNTSETESAGAFVTAGCRTRILIRGTGSADARVAEFAGMLDLPERTTDTVLMARTPQAWLLGAGWSAVDTSQAGPFRWVEGSVASLLLPVERTDARRLRLQIFGQDGPAVRVAVEFGDDVFAAQEVEPGWQWLEWTLQRPLSTATHSLTLRISEPNGDPVEGRRAAISQVELLPPRIW